MASTDVPLTDAPDVFDDDFSDDDSEFDYQSCVSCISSGKQEDVDDRELEILHFNHNKKKWEPFKKSDVQDLLRPSTGWMLEAEWERRRDAGIGSRAMCLDAIAVLSETVGGVAEEWWRDLLPYREKHDVRYNFFWGLQALVFLIMSNNGASTDTLCWRFEALYIPSQKMYHQSYTSNVFEGSIMLDHSPDRPSKDLAEVMRIALPYFREMKARLDTLSSNTGYSSDSALILGTSNLASLITCLDVAESVAKLLPVFGDVLEGACGILRKTVQAAESARSARNECRQLAEHIASITLAILQEIGAASTLSGDDINRICDLRQTLDTVNARVQRFSKLGRTKYLFYRGRINAEVMDLRAQVDNARIAFNIRNDISTTRLLADLRNMHIRLASRVEDIYEGQQTTHQMLRAVLAKVESSRSGGAYINQAD